MSNFPVIKQIGLRLKTAHVDTGTLIFQLVRRKTGIAFVGYSLVDAIAIEQYRMTFANQEYASVEEALGGARAWIAQVADATNPDNDGVNGRCYPL